MPAGGTMKRKGPQRPFPYPPDMFDGQPLDVDVQGHRIYLPVSSKLLTILPTPENGECGVPATVVHFALQQWNIEPPAELKAAAAKAQAEAYAAIAQENKLSVRGMKQAYVEPLVVYKPAHDLATSYSTDQLGRSEAQRCTGTAFVPSTCCTHAGLAAEASAAADAAALCAVEAKRAANDIAARPGSSSEEVSHAAHLAQQALEAAQQAAEGAKGVMQAIHAFNRLAAHEETLQVNSKEHADCFLPRGSVQWYCSLLLKLLADPTAVVGSNLKFPEDHAWSTYEYETPPEIQGSRKSLQSPARCRCTVTAGSAHEPPKTHNIHRLPEGLRPLPPPASPWTNEPQHRNMFEYVWYGRKFSVLARLRRMGRVMVGKDCWGSGLEAVGFWQLAAVVLANLHWLKRSWSSRLPENQLQLLQEALQREQVLAPACTAGGEGSLGADALGNMLHSQGHHREQQRLQLQQQQQQQECKCRVKVLRRLLLHLRVQAILAEPDCYAELKHKVKPTWRARCKFGAQIDRWLAACREAELSAKQAEAYAAAARYSEYLGSTDYGNQTNSSRHSFPALFSLLHPFCGATSSLHLEA